MEADVLERLLMDRALGGLAPDVDVLLTAYLEQDGAAAARAREFETAAAAARRVFTAGDRLALPAFPAARIAGLEQTRRQLRLVRNVASLAAAVVIGIGLGVAFFRAPGVQSNVLRQPGDGALAVAPAAPRGEFWSAERLYEQARRTKRPDTSRLIWDSAVSAPRLGEEL